MNTILLIEDNESILATTAEILALANYEVDTAENGTVGMHKAITNNPDLILCDIMMPQLDGYGVLKMVQNHPRLMNTPFIFLTAKNEHGDFRKGMSLGADDYITKPFDPEDLLKTVERRLKKVRQPNNLPVDDTSQAVSVANVQATFKSFVEGRHVDSYRKRERIFSEGNHPVRIYYVKRGKVKVYIMNSDGKSLIVQIINEGEFFGYNAIFQNTCYQDNAEALENCDIISIARSEFEAFIHAHHDICRRFISKLAGEVTVKELQLIHLAYDSLRKKVADALLSVHRSFLQTPAEGKIDLSRDNLAAIAGTATESFTRTLSDFRSEKLIDIKDGVITILDVQKLEEMIN